MNCQICGRPDPVSLLKKLHVPILMHKLYTSPSAAREAKLGPLEMVGCRHCGFVCNAAFDPSLIEYSDDYENNQTHSVAFKRHLDLRVAAILDSTPDDIDYLEIGCGQGDFMERVIRTQPQRFKSAEGFDTVWRGSDQILASGARVHKSYFDRSTAALLKRQPNVVVTRHTIEHVPNPIQFLTSIREALGPASTARLFVETPCVQWIIENAALQDFFYEHCSIFSRDSLALALRRSGFRNDLKIDRVFGDQYLWATAVAGEPDCNADASCNIPIASIETMKTNFIDKWWREVAKRRSDGPIAIWGAGAKGITFALLVGRENTFDHAIDMNPGKQGHFMPGSGIGIVTPGQSAKRAPATIFVMNPNYLSEITKTCAEVGIKAALVPIN
jgi:Methyltransferase domain/C-methyltransferase C-terminal domain